MAVPRAWWHAAAAAVLCVLLVAGQMPHLIQAPDAHMWGAASADGLGLIWTLWHASEHVMRLGSPGFQSQLAGFPEGGAFWPANPVEAFLLAPVSNPHLKQTFKKRLFRNGRTDSFFDLSYLPQSICHTIISEG